MYLQLDATAMGNSTSPILANIIMNDITTTVSRSVSFFQPFMKVYVDDTIATVPYNKINKIFIISIIITYSIYNIDRQKIKQHFVILSSHNIKETRDKLMTILKRTGI